MKLRIISGLVSASVLTLVASGAAHADPGGLRGQVYIEQIQTTTSVPNGYRPRNMLGATDARGWGWHCNECDPSDRDSDWHLD